MWEREERLSHYLRIYELSRVAACGSEVCRVFDRGAEV